MPRPQNLRTTLALAILGTLLLLGGPDARASSRRAYQTDKEFGLGIMLGAPSGLSGKYFFDGSRTALAFGVGTYQDFYYHRGTQLHVDLLFHPAVLADTRAFSLPFYLGIGGRILDHDDYYRNDLYYDGHSHTGVRVPFGISFDFKRAPLDLFAELVPVWDFLGDQHYDHDLDITGAIGLRYYF